MSMTQLWNMPVPQLQQYLVTASEWLLHQIAQEPIQHGMHRQTVEAALGELQSAELVGADAVRQPCSTHLGRDRLKY